MSPTLHCHSTPPAPVLAALALSLLAVTNAGATPSVRYSWDDCSPIVTNKNWSGPGTYVQVLAAVGLEPGVQSMTFGIGVGVVRDAWSFSDSRGDYFCQPYSRFALSTSGTGCAAAPLTSFSFEHGIGITDPRHGYKLSVNFDPGFVPDPAVRYTVARLAFDHSHSVAGFAAPGSGNCGQVDEGECFALGYATYSGGGPGGELPLESDFLTWQDFNANLYPGARPCPAAVPTRSATWGAIKSQYR